MSVTLRDINGAPASLGVDQLLFAQITNERRKYQGFKMNNASSRDEALLNINIFDQMILNSDGTYHYNFTITKPLNITISAILYTKGEVLVSYLNYEASSDRQTNNLLKSDFISYTKEKDSLWRNITGIYDYVELNFLIKCPISRVIYFKAQYEYETHVYIGKYLISAANYDS